MVELFALIRPESKYADQCTGTPFPVALDVDVTDGYIWRGGIGGQYRHSDLQLFQKHGGRLHPVPFFHEEDQYFDVLLNQMERDAAEGNYWPDSFDERVDRYVERLTACKQANRDNQVEEESDYG